MRSRPPGWIPPGPLPAGPQEDPTLRPGPDETLDCLSGHWKIFQLRNGHRYSTDDLLTAWYAVHAVREGIGVPGSYLDLGCGVGSVCLLVAWHFPGVAAVGIEAQEVSAALASRSARYNVPGDRVEIRSGDFRAARVLAPEERFDLITGSPPYLRPGEGKRSPLRQRGPCRFEDRGGAEDYLNAMAAHLGAGGAAVWVHATRYLDENLKAAEKAGFKAVYWKRIAFRGGAESLVTLFCGRGEESGETTYREEPPLTVRASSGAWTDEYREIRRSMGFPA